nr:FAD-binding oxidoreductase [Agromyces marinus]
MARRDRRARPARAREPRRDRGIRGRTRHRLRVRAQRRPRRRDRTAPGRVAARGRSRRGIPRRRHRQAARRAPGPRRGRLPTYLGAIWNTRTSAILHPAKLAAELARVAEEAGVEIFEDSPVTRLDTPGSTGAVQVVTDRGRVDATRAVLATNVFPALLKRNRLMTVPVYDYVLMTEPLTDEQRASIGWANRQGIGDMANQFHYSRMTRDGRILYGGYDAIYHFGGRIRDEYEDRPESFRKLASHFFTTYPQLEGLRFTHQWAGAIDTSTQFTAFTGLARDGRVAYASGFTGLGVASTRFMAETMLDLLAGRDTERTRLKMVKTRPLPFPPEPAASLGINATRWSLDRADHNGGRRNVLLKTLDALGLGFDS